MWVVTTIMTKKKPDFWNKWLNIGYFQGGTGYSKVGGEKLEGKEKRPALMT